MKLKKLISVVLAVLMLLPLGSVAASADDLPFTDVAKDWAYEPIKFVYEKGLRHEQMIAVVTEFYRGEKRHSVNEPGYKIYCRLWHWSRPLRHFWRRGINFLRRHLK